MVFVCDGVCMVFVCDGVCMVFVCDGVWVCGWVVCMRVGDVRRGM